MKRRRFLPSLFVVLFLNSCLTGGTHGSIKAYLFPVSKPILQRAVETVIRKYPDIFRDTTKKYIIDVTNGKSDTIIDNRYNDGQEYWTIRIKNNEDHSWQSEYTFQCEGNGDTTKTSDLSIAYAYDEKGNGGSNENGGVTWHTPFLKSKLIKLFENKFINRIDKELGKKHIDE